MRLVKSDQVGRDFPYKICLLLYVDICLLLNFADRDIFFLLRILLIFYHNRTVFSIFI